MEKISALKAEKSSKFTVDITSQKNFKRESLATKIQIVDMKSQKSGQILLLNFGFEKIEFTT